MNRNLILRNLRENKMREPAHKSLGPKKASKCWKNLSLDFSLLAVKSRLGTKEALCKRIQSLKVDRKKS